MKEKLIKSFKIEHRHDDNFIFFFLNVKCRVNIYNEKYLYVYDRSNIKNFGQQLGRFNCCSVWQGIIIRRTVEKCEKKYWLSR